MPALRFCYCRTGRLSLCAGCAGRKYSDRNSARSIETARCATAGSEILRRAAAGFEGNWCEVHAFAFSGLIMWGRAPSPVPTQPLPRAAFLRRWLVGPKSRAFHPALRLRILHKHFPDIPGTGVLSHNQADPNINADHVGIKPVF